MFRKKAKKVPTLEEALRAPSKVPDWDDMTPEQRERGLEVMREFARANQREADEARAYLRSMEQRYGEDFFKKYGPGDQSPS